VGLKMEENLENIELDLPVDELFQLMLMAHKEDMTLNKLVEKVLKQYIEQDAWASVG
jgi:hypothetical protein